MQRPLDAAGVSLSALCLVHCLALPLVAAALPIAADLAEAEWIHWAVIATAAPVTILAIRSILREKPVRGRIPILAAGGLGLLVLGVLGIPTAASETAMTVTGGLTLASAHILNWRRAHKHSQPRQGATTPSSLA